MSDIYYKVVEKYTLKSFLAARYKMDGLILPDKYQITYIIGEWVYPKVKNSKLYVFDDIEKAKRYAYGGADIYSIYRCKVKNPLKTSIIGVWNCPHYFKDFVNEPWKTDIAPSNTIMCDAVLLTSRV